MISLEYVLNAPRGNVPWNALPYWTHFEAYLKKKMATDSLEGPYTGQMPAVGSPSISRTQDIERHVFRGWNQDPIGDENP
jgi:hypothetical protein